MHVKPLKTKNLYALRKDANMEKDGITTFLKSGWNFLLLKKFLILKVAQGSCVRDFDHWTPYRGGHLTGVRLY